MKPHFLVGVLFFQLLPFTTAIFAKQTAVARVVNTTSGSIIGHAAPNNTRVIEYLGILYAAAPVGSQRFLPPQRFTSTTTFNASKFGASCPANILGTVAFPNKTAVFDRVFLAFTTQGGNFQSEDCLNLNIWAPDDDSVSCKAKPVLVFFPGGRWNTGGSKSIFYQGQYLADAQDIIVVTINYRLNIFGFPGAPGITQNAGLLDQRMALEWLRDNIAAFGGDPNLITIFGQSAGAVSVGYYPYSYQEDPIIAGSILESGTPHSWTPLTPELAAQHWYNASSFAGCGSSGDVLSCMQALNFTEVLAAFAKVPYDPSAALLQPQFQPVVDNITVFSNYSTMAAAGKLAKVPTLIGNNDFESGFYQIAAFSTSRPFNQTQQKFFNLEAFTCAAAIETQARVSAGIPTWRYRYFSDFENLRLFPGSGTYHGSELEMIFGTAEDVSRLPNSKLEDKISAYFMSAWATFTRNPVNGLVLEMGWPLYGDSSEPTLVRLGYGIETTASFVSPASSDSLCPALNGATDLGKGAM